MTDAEGGVEREQFGAPLTLGRIAYERVMRGEYRLEVADDLDVDLASFEDEMALEVDRRVAAGGSPRERMAMLHSTLDAVTERAWQTLAAGSTYTDPSALLDVLVEVARLKAQLIAGAGSTTNERDRP